MTQNGVICCSVAELRKLEEERHLLSKVKNEIEAFVFDAQDKLEQRDYKLCSTEDERVMIMSKLSEASDWLIEQEDSTPRKVWLLVADSTQSLNMHQSIESFEQQCQCAELFTL